MKWSFFLADTIVASGFKASDPKRILTSKILNIITVYYTVTELASFTKRIILNESNVMEWCSKYTIDKFQINTIVINKLFPVFYDCIELSLIVFFFYFTKGFPFGSLVNLVGYSKKPAKIGVFCIEIKGKEKTNG